MEDSSIDKSKAVNDHSLDIDKVPKQTWEIPSFMEVVNGSEDKLEGKTKKGRVRKIWDRLFGNIASTEEVTDKSKDSEFGLFNLGEFSKDKKSLNRNQNIDSDLPLTESNETETKSVNYNRNSDGYSDIKIDNVSDESLDSEKDTTEIHPESNDLRPITQSSKIETTPLFNQDSRENNQKSYETNALENIQNVSDNAIDFERISHDKEIEKTDRLKNEEVPKTDTVRRIYSGESSIYNRWAIEHSVRKESRKVKREVHKTNNILEQQVNKLNNANKSNETVYNVNKIIESRNEIVKPERVTEIKKGSITSNKENIVQTIENKENINKNMNPEIIIKNTLPTELSAAETVFERVKDAAEHNEPQEKIYELRQEIKDEPSTTNTSVSVGAVIAKAVADVKSQSTSQLAATESLRKVTAKNQQLELSSGSSMYKKAMLSGAITALIIIVFGLIAYFTFK